MPSPLDSPVVRYGMSLMSAAAVAVVAFAFLDGTIRWVALGIAALELVVTPQILKQAA
ncbi:hypothetical protein [Halobellus clavatus]|jgi:hypothetical protein|uniref:Uncharacterized protein n=1 Tax=Halobellus clavatus TaxID=660517 RepID=A0A1H3JET5_9EURY|nr:hypothetical protein [Halobellus clavatus]SDY38421.1 hypothetical protein SAMN04487946_11352 [Halobellus clavatus]